MPFKNNKLLLFSLIFFVVSAVVLSVSVYMSNRTTTTDKTDDLEKIEKNQANNSQPNETTVKEQTVKANEPILKPHAEVLNPQELFNILILGIDRRYAQEASYRTDIIMLATINLKTNKVVFTSIPRDLWAGSQKINGVYVTEGFEALKSSIKEITGQEVDRFIRIDFDALVWVVDAMGGVDVGVENTFTDSEYPNDRNGNPNEGISVSFTQGKMHLDGETALIYSRSRHGDNGEGSDFARSKRQQIILKSMPENFLAVSSKNIFNPFNLQSFYTTINQHVKTDMNVRDMGVVYDLLKDRSKYTVQHFVLDYNYIVHPGISDTYGGQWVVIGKEADYASIKTHVNELLR